MGTLYLTIGRCKSYIVVMAGRWVMYDNGSWDFKIDNDRMGRTVDSSGITGADGLSMFSREGKSPPKSAIGLMMERVIWWVQGLLQVR